MKTLFCIAAMVLALGVVEAQAQDKPSSPAKPAPPTQTDQDQINNDKGAPSKDVVFPPDVVDSTATDTSDIGRTNLDSAGVLRPDQVSPKNEDDNPDSKKTRPLNQEKANKSQKVKKGGN